VHPQDLPRLSQYLGQLELLERGPSQFEYRVRDAAGTWRWFLAREAVFDRDETGRVSQVLGITTEITDLKITQRRLVESEELLAERVRVLEGILDSAGEGIVVLDENARFTVFNPAARRIVGEAPAIGALALEGQSYSLLDPQTRQTIPKDELPLARALGGEASDNVELLVSTKDNLETLIRVTGRPLRDTNGAPRGALITFNDITALRAAENELSLRAVTDPLTGLPNRRALDERLQLLIAEGGRGRRFALVLGDVDHFKKVNDTHGHAAGDAVLVHVAQTLKCNVRCTDFVARYGGEEFVVLYADIDETNALRLAEGLRIAIADSNGPLPITISFGVCANRPNERTDASAVLNAADRALYAAKRQGRDRVALGQLSRRDSIPIVPAQQAKARA
jgi:two-component system, cell cycle response regulator